MNRLPFFTRGILLLVVLSSVAGLIVSWIIPASALIPSQVSIFAGMVPVYSDARTIADLFV